MVLAGGSQEDGKRHLLRLLFLPPTKDRVGRKKNGI
jgi:hypothetical protein